MSYKLLIINPGSTSTKIGVYEDEKELFEETLRHSTEEINKYENPCIFAITRIAGVVEIKTPK